VTHGWKKLHNEELHNLHTSIYVTRMTKLRMKWTWHVACLWEMTSAYKILVDKPKGKRKLGRTMSS
jgi:hypothetical protein